MTSSTRTVKSGLKHKSAINLFFVTIRNPFSCKPAGTKKYERVYKDPDFSQKKIMGPMPAAFFAAHPYDPGISFRNVGIKSTREMKVTPGQIITSGSAFMYSRQTVVA